MKTEKKSLVVLVPCGEYERETVAAAVETGMALVERCGPVARPEEKILLKPNLLRGADPEKAITTHPDVLAGVISCLQKTGRTQLTCGDSPASMTADRAAKLSGLADVEAEFGVPAGDFTSCVRVENPTGRVAKELMLSKAVADADAVISVCKMKTHAMMRVTGAVKNSYGFIQGRNKTAGHVKYPGGDRFVAMLTDLNLYVRPRLYIMDGIVAMEGNGPASGDPVKMGVLLFSSDPVALDSVFCRLVYLDPKLVATNVCGEREGLGVWREENISVLTPEGPASMAEIVEKYGRPDFRVYRGPSQPKTMALMSSVFSPLLSRPVIDAEKCVRCGVCVDTCPVEGGAVTFAGGKDRVPVYDYRKCIRCFCCQEMCPQRAIFVRRPLGLGTKK